MPGGQRGLGIEAMSQAASLPLVYERSFSIWFYWVSHGLLLLRSGITNAHATRIDLLFCDVRWMALPVWMDGICIERGKLSDLPLPLTRKIVVEAHFMTVYKASSQGVTHCLLAGKNVYTAEDQEDYGADSSLLPGYDFRALQARELS